MQKSEAITIVSGLPRSGTSLMMQMLQAGGMPVLTDNVRQADISNPRGYFELEAVKQTRHHAAWLVDAPGRAVKIIYRLLYDLPDGYEYRVLFMRRELRQVVASQQAMLGKTDASDAENRRLMAIFQKELDAVDAWLKGQRHFTVLHVPHDRIIRHTADQVEQIKTFLNCPLHTAAMCTVVDPALHRRR
jgi:hypothetical protein